MSMNRFIFLFSGGHPSILDHPERLLEFEVPLENQVIHLESNRREAQQIQLICRLTVCEQRARVQWSYNDSPRLPLALFNTSFDGRTARLCARNLQPEHSGSYACEVRLPSGSSMAYTQCQVTIFSPQTYGKSNYISS